MPEIVGKGVLFELSTMETGYSFPLSQLSLRGAIG
jgi:hypothetical protein